MTFNSQQTATTNSREETQYGFQSNYIIIFKMHSFQRIIRHSKKSLTHSQNIYIYIYIYIYILIETTVEQTQILVLLDKDFK